MTEDQSHRSLPPSPCSPPLVNPAVLKLNSPGSQLPGLVPQSLTHASSLPVPGRVLRDTLTCLAQAQPGPRSQTLHLPGEMGNFSAWINSGGGTEGASQACVLPPRFRWGPEAQRRDVTWSPTWRWQQKAGPQSGCPDPPSRAHSPQMFRPPPPSRKWMEGEAGRGGGTRGGKQACLSKAWF